MKRERTDFVYDEYGPHIKQTSGQTALNSTANFLTAAIQFGGMIQGTANNHRVGRSVRLLRLSGHVEINAGTAATPASGARLVILLRKHPNGAALGAINPFTSLYGPMDIAQSREWELLHDETVPMGIVGTAVLSAAGPLVQCIDVDIPLDVVQVYTGTAGVIANMITNALYGAVVGTTANGGQFYWSLEYTDAEQ